jgi:hypothetical protein
MIDILIPVLGRPQNAAKVAESIDEHTKVPHKTIFLCSRGDEEEIEACKHTRGIVWLCDDDRYAAKINEGARIDLFGFPSTFIFLGADDLAFHDDWDVNAIAHFEEIGKPVIGTNDLGNPTVMAGRHATHSLVHRLYLEFGTIDDPSKLLHEGYDHNWVDTEFIETAMMRDAFTFCRDSHVEHLHPFWKKGPMDVIYKKGAEKYHHDNRLFRERRRLWRERAR